MYIKKPPIGWFFDICVSKGNRRVQIKRKLLCVLDDPGHGGGATPPACDGGDGIPLGATDKPKDSGYNLESFGFLHPRGIEGQERDMSVGETE